MIGEKKCLVTYMNQIVRPRRTAWKKSTISLKNRVKTCAFFVVQKHYLRAKICNSLAGLISYFFPRLYAKKTCPFLLCLYLSSIDYAHLFARRMIEKYALVELVEWCRVESSGVESSRMELNSSEFRIHGIDDSF